MSPTRWAAPPVGKHVLQTLHQAEARYPVSLIETERATLVTCDADDDAHEMASKDQVADFDHLPVVSDGAIIGLFNCKSEHRSGKVREVMQPVSERILMSADASMLDFLQIADETSFVFLISGNQISGAVTLSDIQKIAARPPMFLRLTLFENLVTNWIRENANDSWLEKVKLADRTKIERSYARRSAERVEMDLIAVADLRPKLDAAWALGAFNGLFDTSEWLVKLNDFRNSIAHAHEFAANPISAAVIPSYLRQLHKCVAHFEAKMLCR